MFSDLTFQPKTNKTSKYKVTKDVVERNQEFITKKNEKIKQRKERDNSAYNFTPTMVA